MQNKQDESLGSTCFESVLASKLLWPIYEVHYLQMLKCLYKRKKNGIGMECGQQKEENDECGKAHLEMRPYRIMWSMTFEIDHLQVFERLAKKVLVMS